jgi:hypothetical protein
VEQLRGLTTRWRGPFIWSSRAHSQYRFLAILTIGRSTEIDDLNAPTEVEERVLGLQLRWRDLAPLKAADVLFARSLLFGARFANRFIPLAMAVNRAYRLNRECLARQLPEQMRPPQTRTDQTS